MIERHPPNLSPPRWEATPNPFMSEKPRAAIEHDPRAARVREYHHLAMVSANQAVAAAIFAGLELRAVQSDLKKSATGGTFDDWLDKHQETLCFSRRTAFRYTGLADKIKNKLLAKRDPSLDRLLSLAPSEMTAPQAKLLLQTLHKSVDGESLTALYQDFGIVKLPRLNNAKPKGGDTRSAQSAPTPELLIQDDLFAPLKKDDLYEAWHRKLKVGNRSVPLWQHMTDDQKREALRLAEIKRRQYDDIVADLEKALEGK